MCRTTSPLSLKPTYTAPLHLPRFTANYNSLITDLSTTILRVTRQRTEDKFCLTQISGLADIGMRCIMAQLAEGATHEQILFATGLLDPTYVRSVLRLSVCVLCCVPLHHESLCTAFIDYSNDRDSGSFGGRMRHSISWQKLAGE